MRINGRAVWTYRVPTVSPQQWNNQDAITSAKLNTPTNQIAAVINGQLDDANIASLSGTKINAGTLPATAMDTATNVITRTAESGGDFVVPGGVVWSISSGLVGTMTAGIVYIGGKRVVVAAIASRTFTASKDTYVSVDNTGTVSYSEVANNAASPALPANSVWVAVVISGASISSINTGNLDAVAPVVSGAVLRVSTSLGDLICPQPFQRLVGYREITSTFSTAASSSTFITGLSVPVKVSASQRLIATVYCRTLSNNTAGASTAMELWKGATSGALTTEVDDIVIDSGTASKGAGATLRPPTTIPSGTTYLSASGKALGGGTSSFSAFAAVPMFIMVELA